MNQKNIAIIISTKDRASLIIKESLIPFFKQTTEKYDTYPIYQKENTKIYTTDKESIHCEHIDKEIEAKLFIFATKHKSESGIPTLSCHVPGNWGKAELGGKPNQLCICPSNYIKVAYLLLKEKTSDTKYEASLEQTHHGPYLETPIMFIEIGSKEEEWQDKSAGKIIAETILELLKPLEEIKTVMVIGGGHYNKLSNKILEQTSYAVGHICAKFLLENLTKETLKSAIKRHTFPVEKIVLDWKGLGKEKERIINLLESEEIEYIRGKNLINNS